MIGNLRYLTTITSISQNNHNKSKIKPTNNLRLQIIGPILEHKEALNNLCLQSKITKTCNQSSSTIVSLKNITTPPH